MQKTQYIEKRLIGNLDIDFDNNNNDDTFEIIDELNNTLTLEKISTKNIPNSKKIFTKTKIKNLDFLLEQIIEDISKNNQTTKILLENINIDIDQNTTTFFIQNEINKIPKNLNQFTITITVNSQNYTWNDTINITNFYNGKIEIKANNSIINTSITTPLINIENCFSNIIINQFKPNPQSEIDYFFKFNNTHSLTFTDCQYTHANPKNEFAFLSENSSIFYNENTSFSFKEKLFKNNSFIQNQINETNNKITKNTDDIKTLADQNFSNILKNACENIWKKITPDYKNSIFFKRVTTTEVKENEWKIATPVKSTKYGLLRLRGTGNNASFNAEIKLNDTIFADRNYHGNFDIIIKPNDEITIDKITTNYPEITFIPAIFEGETWTTPTP